MISSPFGNLFKRGGKKGRNRGEKERKRGEMEGKKEKGQKKRGIGYGSKKYYFVVDFGKL